MKHALYRFYGQRDELLYVGITMNPAARWAKHADDKPWWHEVSQITIETLPDRAAVLEAEKRAIRTERPLHNIVHNRPVTVTAPAPAETQHRHLFAVGDVVAVGIHIGETAPVGMVDEVNDDGFVLDLFSWLTGFFGHDARFIPWGHVKSFMRASLMAPEVAQREGYRSDVVVWDMDPLAQFQNDWKTP